MLGQVVQVARTINGVTKLSINLQAFSVFGIDETNELLNTIRNERSDLCGEDFTIYPARKPYEFFFKHMSKILPINYVSDIYITGNSTVRNMRRSYYGYAPDLAAEFYFRFGAFNVIVVFHECYILLPVSVFVECDTSQCEDMMGLFAKQNPSFDEIGGYHSLRTPTPFERRMLIERNCKSEACFIMDFSTSEFALTTKLIQFSRQIYDFFESCGVKIVVFCKGEVLVSSQENNLDTWERRIEEYLAAGAQL